MADRIELVGLRAKGFHGVFDSERREGQEFLVDLVLHLDTAPAALSDDLADTVDYGLIAQQVHDVVAGDPVDLIETLAARIVSVVLAHDVVEAVDVAVHKPHAPIQVPFDDVVLRIHRRREAR